MRHQRQKFTLSKSAAQRKALVRKLAISFVTHGKLQTSAAKAKFLRAYVEPLVTKAKSGGLPARRALISALGNRAAAAALLKRAEAYQTRPGGYTRITKLALVRAGDRTRLVLLEFV
jgi:large subunit ribosomal protein L17